MKKRNLLAGLIVISILSGLNSQAQVSGLLQKAKDKAAQKASDALDKKTSTTTATTTETNTTTTQRSSKPVINSGFDFIPGDSLIFTDDFSKIAVGSSPHSFKTNGAGQIVTIDNEPGKWLALESSATYKFSKQLFYPKHFTFEFDILAIADKVGDIYPLDFGFVKDNSVSQYNAGEGAYVGLKYYNDNDIDVNSQYLSKFLNTKFDLTAYANRKMHVSLVVDGDKMIVYLEKTKIADTQAFLPTDTKNFYISGPMQYHNGSKILISNFRVARFKNS